MNGIFSNIEDILLFNTVSRQILVHIGSADLTVQTSTDASQLVRGKAEVLSALHRSDRRYLRFSASSGDYLPGMWTTAGSRIVR